ncbi:4497_t:CDS:1, partial [Ambispora gerdemannii]
KINGLRELTTIPTVGLSNIALKIRANSRKGRGDNNYTQRQQISNTHD